MKKYDFSKIIKHNGAEIQLRLISENDIEFLRIWKNANKQYFFHANEITSEQQSEWYKKYLLRDSDYMFVVIIQELPIGCMGIRYLNDKWDAYNIILGDLSYNKLGYMSICFQQMLDFATQIQKSPIELNVLKTNPAVGWYKKQGFVISSVEPSHFKMKKI